MRSASMDEDPTSLAPKATRKSTKQIGRSVPIPDVRTRSLRVQRRIENGSDGLEEWSQIVVVKEFPPGNLKTGSLHRLRTLGISTPVTIETVDTPHVKHPDEWTVSHRPTSREWQRRGHPQHQIPYVRLDVAVIHPASQGRASKNHLAGDWRAPELPRYAPGIRQCQSNRRARIDARAGKAEGYPDPERDVGDDPIESVGPFPPDRLLDRSDVEPV
jgi:hypothetical protein